MTAGYLSHTANHAMSSLAYQQYFLSFGGWTVVAQLYIYSNSRVSDMGHIYKLGSSSVVDHCVIEVVLLLFVWGVSDWPFCFKNVPNGFIFSSSFSSKIISQQLGLWCKIITEYNFLSDMC